ncbi:HAMP domain-containing histidine kinase [Acidovorax sp. NCPPB 2350]|nr:HAMP domain-containing histidine kinase [Acidovorax sp. NCPPB 2350]
MSFGKPRWPASLRMRLLATCAVGMVLSAALVGLCVFMLATPLSRYLLQNIVADNAAGIAEHIRFDAAGRPTGLDETKIEPWILTSLRDELVLRILDAQGQVVYPPGEREGPLAPDGQGFDPSRAAFTLVREGVTMHAATAPLKHRGQVWYVQFATSDRLVLLMHESIGMPALQRGIVLSCLVFLAVFMVTTHFTLKRMLAPLRAASAEARRITPRTLEARLHERGLPTEIQPLVAAFNTALDRLQHGFQTQQEFLASAAHELKTPLALIRAQVELEPQGPSAPDLLKDVDRMARQVQQLLHLAEASELHNYKIECIDPRLTIREVADYMDRVARRHTVHIDLRLGDGPLQWQADRGALFTLLKNLLENAIQHSPVGGVVRLSASPSGMVVADQGPGVPAAQLPRIFDRFWRGAARRDDGAGLGLSICQEIASAHRWRIAARVGTAGLEVEVHVAPPDTGAAGPGGAAAGPAPRPQAPAPALRRAAAGRRARPACPRGRRGTGGPGA